MPAGLSKEDQENKKKITENPVALFSRMTVISSQYIQIHTGETEVKSL